MDRLYVDWDLLKHVGKLDIGQAEEMARTAYSKADKACRDDRDVYAGGVADGMVFAMSLLELVRKGMEENGDG